MGEQLRHRLGAGGRKWRDISLLRILVFTKSTHLLSLNSLFHTNYLLCPFVFSLFGSLGKVALSFLHDFAEIVEKRTGRNFDVRFWTNRIVFAIFKGMVSLVSNSLLSLGKFYEERIVEFTSSRDLAFDDVLC
ncbi:hypothetical protein RCL1_002380 [Eukaryota sp. TZLM3-RCL]